jgi:hypothetical protein
VFLLLLSMILSLQKCEIIFSQSIFLVYIIHIELTLVSSFFHLSRSMKNPLVVYPKGIRVPEQDPAGRQVAKTTLSQQKGLTVATITPAAVSPLATLGVFLPSGSRYETHKTAGASHLMKHLAFKVNVLSVDRRSRLRSNCGSRFLEQHRS